jgi:YYY domain-containing protein
MNRDKYFRLYDILLLLVLVLAGYLRLTGVHWGEGEHQHPDENFLSSVLGSLQAHKCADGSTPIDACPAEQRVWMGIGDYFDSRTSTLNPYNRGYAFFVYGNLPLTVVRVAAEVTGQFDVKTLGRQFSAFADLFTILILYAIISRLYNRRVALLASLFSALTVMQIQQSHFFTTDLFVNLFAFLAIYFAVAIGDTKYKKLVTGDLSSVSEDSLQPSVPNSQFSNPLSLVLRNPLFLLSLGFGVAYGLALASKVNIYPLAVLLPGAFVVRYILERKNQESLNTDHWRTDYWLLILACLIAGGLAALISFRVFQPYAFDGIGLNPQWVANIQEQRVQAKGDADLPWNLQWARRSNLYSFTNLTVWGLGLPLGILAWAGFLYMGWRILKGERRHALLWGWTAAYFLWQSLQFNPTMRYQLPIYPLLAMMAAWVIFELAGLNPSTGSGQAVQTFKRFNLPKILANVIGITVVALTSVWAFAFHSIYLRDEPRIAASRWIYQNVPGPINLHIQTPGGAVYNQPLPIQPETAVDSARPYDISFVAQTDGLLTGISLGHANNAVASPSTLELTLSNGMDHTSDQVLTTASITADFSADNDPRGDHYTIELDKAVQVTGGTQYHLRLQIDAGILALYGSAVVNETDYDYPLPFRVDGYDAFGGIYRGDLNLQVYWDDNAEKLTRFSTTLDQADYILIPTNHQYGQITRLPERYPLTTLYYRELVGCPSGENIIHCYYKAKPGTYAGRLGFDLVAVFETFPKLGSLEINDQYAEEAFTFYDHPKVMVFKKNKDYNSAQVQSVLGAVDLEKVVRLTPRQFDDFSNLLLPPDRLASQRAGGTWSELFDYDWVQNKYPWLGLILWYVFIFILGLAVYPLIRLAMPGLADKGYPLSRALGLVLFGYFAWMAGSLGAPYTRTTIAIIFGLILLTGGVLAWYQRGELREEWSTRRKYFLFIEGIFLSFFLIDLFIRLGNPDLWHPARGGERPMDFSYFNAVLKSTSFPPYDPWFAGGHINYYYYGFVLVATPVKLLGIVPSIAYNFILPTLFALVASCAFSLGWNLLSNYKSPSTGDPPSGLNGDQLVAGFSASFLTILLGNLGTVQLIYNRLQQLGAVGGFSWDSTLTQRLGWAMQGLALIFKGAALPIGPGDWYWDPSRVVPPKGGNEITEFPLFTFIYSDLHAHMIAMPIMLLALSWALAVAMGRAGWRNQASAGLGFVVGGLIIGALYPTNLSDMYTFLPVGLAAIGYAIWRYVDSASIVKRIALVIAAISALTVLSFFLYQPYRAWYAQAYSALDPWKGPFTPVMSYVTMWGVFLFIIAAWMAWETREWMASTPLSALRKLKPYQILIEGALVVFVVFLLAIQYIGTSVGWIALPLAAWAGILLFRPDLPDSKRFVLFLIGTAMLITLVVELVVVRGDIGRQNTIFKFYLQAWFMLAISSAAAFTWTLPAFFRWLPGWRLVWQSAMVLLVAGAAMFTITGTSGKIRDRWILEAPRTLDSMTFMNYAQYDDFGQRLDLSEDYRAIRWMQDNVQGSPVIVEANCVEYHWCTRFTVYTGLPGVVGWNWHQRQQRVFTSTWVEGRVAAVGNFYNSVDPEYMQAFLKTHDVKYIIVGQLERAAYTPEGLAKFDQFDGEFWREVYRDGRTVIYEVTP